MIRCVALKCLQDACRVIFLRARVGGRSAERRHKTRCRLMYTGATPIDIRKWHGHGCRWHWGSARRVGRVFAKRHYIAHTEIMYIRVALKCLQDACRVIFLRARVGGRSAERRHKTRCRLMYTGATPIDIRKWHGHGCRWHWGSARRVGRVFAKRHYIAHTEIMYIRAQVRRL